MLTRKDASCPLNAILVIAILTFICSCAAFVLTIVSKYLGFDISTNPISCSSTSTYFQTKYNQSYYLNAIDAGELISIVASLSLLPILIFLKIRFRRLKDDEQEFESWSYRMYQVLFILFSCCAVTLIIPVGYFLSFIREVGSSCNMSIFNDWIIIAALTLFSLLLNVIATVILFRLRERFDPLEDNETQDKKKTEAKEQKKEAEENKEVKAIKGEEKLNKQKSASNLQHQQQNKIPIAENKELKQPLLDSVQPLRKEDYSKRLEEQLMNQEKMRLLALRRQRLEEEEKVLELQKRKREAEKGKQQKGSANQTIINIHLAGNQPGVTVQDKNKNKRQEDERQPRLKRSKGRKKIGNYTDVIEEQDSQDSTDNYYNAKQLDDRRFYSKNKFQAKEMTPSLQDKRRQSNKETLRESNSKAIIQQESKKKLSLSHLPEVKILGVPSPPTASFINKPIIVQGNSGYQELNAPDNNDESFYQKLLESGIKEKKIQELHTPKKNKPKRKRKDNNLDAYIEELNFSMSASRPDYEKNFNSNGSSVAYNSVLSNREPGPMPGERDYLTKWDGRSGTERNEKRNVASLLEMTHRIEQKYKNK